MSRRIFIAFLISLPFIWLGANAYAEWVEPTGDPATFNLPGPIWLQTDTAHPITQQGFIDVSGNITAGGEIKGVNLETVGHQVYLPTIDFNSIRDASGNWVPNNAANYGMYGSLQWLAGETVFSGLSGKFVGGAGTSVGAAVFGYAFNGTGLSDPLNGGGWAGYFKGSVFSNAYCLPNASTGAIDCISSWNQGGVGSNLWSVEGTGPNIFKKGIGAGADGLGIVAIGGSTPSALSLPYGTKFFVNGVSGEFGDNSDKAPRIYIGYKTGNPEIDFQLSNNKNNNPSSPNFNRLDDHWSIYAAAYPDKDQTTATRNLRFWAKDSQTAADGRNALELSSDGVMIFPGWGKLTPNVIVLPETNITFKNATINAYIDPNGYDANVKLRYVKKVSNSTPTSCDATFSSDTYPDAGIIELTALVPKNVDLTGGTNVATFTKDIPGSGPGSGPALQYPNVTYSYCVIVSNSNGITYGDYKEFATSTPGAPTAANLQANLQGSGTSVIFSVDVTSVASGTAVFSYQDSINLTAPPATCDALSQNTLPSAPLPVTASVNFISSSTPVNVSTNVLSGLIGGHTYYYCVVVDNGGNKVTVPSAAPQSFVAKAPPLVTTTALVSTDIFTLSSYLKGSLDNFNGYSSVTAYFRYYTSSPGGCVDSNPNNIGSGVDGNKLTYGTLTAIGPFSYALGSLSSNTNYWYCAFVNYGTGYSSGNLQSFKTSSEPYIVTNPGGSGDTVVTLNGSFNAAGSSPTITSTEFRWYGSVNPGSCTTASGTVVNPTSGTSSASDKNTYNFSASVSGLTNCTVTYYYCAVAKRGSTPTYYTANVNMTPANNVQSIKAVPPAGCGGGCTKNCGGIGGTA